MRMERSNSLPLPRSTSMLNGVPRHRFIDDSTIQIVIHRPEQADQLFYHFADKIGNWQVARSLYYADPNKVRVPLTVSGDTALHVAVRANNTEFVKGLVSLGFMTPQDLAIVNVDGNSAFHIATIIGNIDFLKIMMEKNKNLPTIRGHDGMLPIHLAALFGYHKIVQYLSSDDLLLEMEFKDVKKLFFMTINNNMYDVAEMLVNKYSQELAVARNEEKLTALHMLARKPSEEPAEMSEIKIEGPQISLLETLWSSVRKLEANEMSNLITRPSVVIFDAVKSGNDVFVMWLFSKSRELLTIVTIKDPQNGRNLLHLAVLHRKKKIFESIIERGEANLIKRGMDKDGNNVLHFAAHQNVETPTSLRPSIQMHQDLAWFKAVEKKVPCELNTMRNKEGKTPKDVLYANSKRLSVAVKKETQDIAQSSMVVATLVASVAFAAVLNVRDEDRSSVASVVFILANAVALFASAASIISFLSIFIFSRFTKIDFITSLHPSLLIGLASLFFSIIAMVIAFGAAVFFIFDNVHKWVPVVVASLAIIPLLAVVSPYHLA